MALKLGSKAKAEPLLDYRTDPRLKALTDRMAEIDRTVPSLEAQAKQAEKDLVGAEDALRQVEMAVIAGRAPDSDLVGPQARLLELKRTQAIARCDLEDLSKERAKLEADLPRARVAAKEAALSGLRRRYLELTAEIQAGLDQAVAADQELRGLVDLAADQYGGNGFEVSDGFPVCGGLRTFQYSSYYRGYGYVTHRLQGDLKGYHDQVARARADVEDASKQSR